MCVFLLTNSCVIDGRTTIDMTEGIITPVTSEERPQVAVSLTQGESSLLQTNVNSTRVSSAPNSNLVADTRGGGGQSSRNLVNLYGTNTSNQANNPPNNHSKLVEFHVLPIGERL